MKIGILTHHYVKNYGAFLQARALSETVKKLYPTAKVEFVNYVYIKHWVLNILHILHYRKDIDTFKIYTCKIKQLQMFSDYENSLPHSKCVFTTKQIKRLNYDILIFGSDEIWDRYGRGYRPLKYGVNMDGAAKKMVAYAPSIGKVDGSEPLSEDLRVGLRNFDAISARDIQTQKMVSQIGIRAPIVLDPTLIYDFDEDLLANNVQSLPYKYTLIYDCKLNQNQIEYLVQYAREKNLEIIGAGDHKPFYTKESICLTPYEWVSLFKNADQVITGTFHGTVFSIKYRKNFLCYPTEKNRIQKITSLLDTLGLDSRLLKFDDVESFKEMLCSNVNYLETQKKQNELYDRSIHFLRGVL